MRSLAVLLLILTAAAPQSQRAEQIALTTDTEALWVPFTLTGANQIRFTAMLAGHPVTAILDTGVSHSALSRRYADAARLRIVSGVAADAIGGSTALGWVDAPPLGFGGLVHRGGRLAVVTLPATATGGEAIDLLVGRDLLAPFALEVDFDAGRFRLLPSGRIPFRGTALPLTIDGVAPAYLSDVPVNGMTFRFNIDTGDGNTITLSAPAWRRVASAVPTTTALSYGVGGSAVTDLAILPSLAIGPLRTGPTEIAIERDGGYSQAAGISGRIGTGFLRRYHILLDPSAGHMLLAPGQRIDVPPLRSTSGLLIVRDGPALRVVHVMRGGPAEATGWQAGETICAVDGVAVASTPPDSPIHWPVDTPGRAVSLALCNGPVRTLTLRAFY